MDPTRGIITILELAVQTERDGWRFYEEAARRSHDPDSKKIFQSLADDERAHERILQRQLERLREGEPPEPIEIGRASAILFTHERLEGSASQYTSDLSALRTAYLIEQDAAAFYARAAEEVKDVTVRTLFHALAEWEQEHRRVLEEAYRFLVQQFKRDVGFEPF